MIIYIRIFGDPQRGTRCGRFRYIQVQKYMQRIGRAGNDLRMLSLILDI